MPYNPQSNRYEIELWSYPGNDLRSKLDIKGAAALDAGRLVVRTDLVQGTLAELAREGKDGLFMAQVAPSHTMHPILPLSLELAWGDAEGKVWISYNSPDYLKARHGIPQELLKNIAVVETIAAKAAE